MSAWLMRHAQTAVGSLGRLSQQKLATAFTMLVIGVALALPAGLHMLVTNAQMATGNWNRSVELTVFFKRPTSVDDAQRTAEKVKQRRDVEAVEFVSADEGLKEFRHQSGLGTAIDALNENPLPHSLVVRPRADAATPEQLNALAADLRAMPSVDMVQLDTAWVERLQAILQSAQRGLWLVAGVLALGVLVIVGNTIRLDIQNRRDEIEITKLVGGTDAFVRRPFLYNGIWYGLGGGLIAWVVAAIGVAILRPPLERLAGLYGSSFSLAGLDLRSTAILILAAAALGWLGSYVSASTHLRRIEPR
ncbi:MAG TPA: permease-like cell division protein FtsX [Steroidobacteraceae bacterium]|nr:permease-like cell division protein FtsX [Steroidobacteraceae bacterium]